LERRVFEHKHHFVEGFTKRYNITKLVYYEETNDVRGAISREKQIKGWLRRKKVALIESVNPETVVISVGENSYGHPAEEVLHLFEQFGIQVLITKEMGDIRFAF
jgi:putative endonuclease